MAVTNNIREIREQRGIYQDDLAAAIGFSTKTVGRIERGDSTPSAEFMLRISDRKSTRLTPVTDVSRMPSSA